MKKKVITGIAALLILLQVNAQKSPVFSNGGKAINGYDPVAFFTEHRAVKGFDSITYPWQGANWYFSTIQNRDSFIARPGLYAPQYGGYCAYGVADGHKSPTAADTWTIAEGKLYFNYNNKVKDFWLKDQKSLIKKADEKWDILRNND